MYSKLAGDEITKAPKYHGKSLQAEIASSQLENKDREAEAPSPLEPSCRLRNASRRKRSFHPIAKSKGIYLVRVEVS